MKPKPSRKTKSATRRSVQPVSSASLPRILIRLKLNVESSLTNAFCHALDGNVIAARESAVACRKHLDEFETLMQNGCRSSAEPIPTVLFHGEAVWRELNDKERTRTTAINVSDVLDAVVRLMRREAGPASNENK